MPTQSLKWFMLLLCRAPMLLYIINLRPTRIQRRISRRIHGSAERASSPSKSVRQFFSKAKSQNHAAIHELIRGIVGANVLSCGMTKVTYRPLKDDKPEMAEAYFRFHKDNCKRVMSKAGQRGILFDRVGHLPFEVNIIPLKNPTLCKQHATLCKLLDWPT